jgi:hypothetical protein
MRFPVRVCAVLALAAACAATVVGQGRFPDESIGGPLTRPSVSGAPFSADATTTVHATLGDGTRLDQPRRSGSIAILKAVSAWKGQWTAFERQ